MSDAAQILFLPGVPGLGLEPSIAASNPYPDTTIDLLKVMRSYGVDASFSEPRENRVDVAHRNADVWLPVVSVVGVHGVGVALNILSNALYDLYVKRFVDPSNNGDPDRPPAQLHIELRYNSVTGEQLVRMDGAASDVIAAIREISGSPDVE